MPNRRIRAAFVALWIGLGVFIFVGWRGHTLLIDNHDVAGLPDAPDLIRISIDGGEGVEFFNGDRDRISLAGIKHKIRIDFSDGSAPFDGSFRLLLRADMYILSIPTLINKQSDAVEVFVQSVQPHISEPEEEDELSAP
jgi:hypothetical protein